MAVILVRIVGEMYEDHVGSDLLHHSFDLLHQPSIVGNGGIGISAPIDFVGSHDFCRIALLGRADPRFPSQLAFGHNHQEDLLALL